MSSWLSTARSPFRSLDTHRSVPFPGLTCPATIIHNLAEAGVHLAILGDNLVNVGQQQGVAEVPELPHGWIGKFVMDVVLHIFGPPRSYGMG